MSSQRSEEEIRRMAESRVAERFFHSPNHIYFSKRFAGHHMGMHLIGFRIMVSLVRFPPCWMGDRPADSLSERICLPQSRKRLGTKRNPKGNGQTQKRPITVYIFRSR